MVYHGHGPWLDMVLIIPWSTMGGHLAKHGRPWSTMVGHGFMTMDYHGRPWYSMVIRPSFSPGKDLYFDHNANFAQQASTGDSFTFFKTVSNVVFIPNISLIVFDSSCYFNNLCYYHDGSLCKGCTMRIE